MIQKRITSSLLLVAYFSHEECQVCKVLKPKVQNLLETMPGIEFIYIDTKLHPRISGQHLVFAAPTIIIFSAGQEQRRYSRHFSVEVLARDLERLQRMFFK